MSLHGYSDGEYDGGSDAHNVTLIYKLDDSLPLHLHLNDSVALNVVSVKLKRTENYHVWSCALLLALDGKNKTGFIDGSCRSTYAIISSKESHRIATGSVFGTSQRNMPLTDYLTLFDVSVVPEYCISLMYVHKVARDSKLIIAFDELKCCILNQDLKWRLRDSLVVYITLMEIKIPYKVTSRDSFRYFLTIVDDFQELFRLNNEDFFNLDGYINHFKIPYDDERSDPGPSRYDTPSSYSGSTSDTHNENEREYSMGSDASASENNRSTNPEDNDNNTSEDETRVCKLNKSLYGLKQAPRQWNAKLTSALIECGFVRSKSDYSLFTKKFGDVSIALLVYIYDNIITTNNLDEINKFKLFLQTKFMIKNLGKFKYFLGIEVLETPTSVCLSQKKYCLELIDESGLLASKPSYIPMQPNISLSSESKDDDPLLDNITDYQKLIGKGVNAIRTSTSVNVLKAYTDAWARCTDTKRPVNE
nr:ribonuclease H-like domain-containing protein [Tanacetum cinerariifolium]